MTVIVIVIAGPAAYLGGFRIHDGDYRVVGDPSALYAVIVNHISQPMI